MNNNDSPLYLGIDMGTSGCRLIAIDENKQIVAHARQSMATPETEGNRVYQDPQIWWQCLEQALTQLAQQLSLARIRAISIDGTSGTIVGLDPQDHVLAPGLMYNDSSCTTQAQLIAQYAPVERTLGVTSGLAKALYLIEAYPECKTVLNQADWLAGHFLGVYCHSDENNALKLAYDPVERCWPDWLKQLPISFDQLPQVHVPGESYGLIDTDVADAWGFAPNCKVIAGTTDSIAAFIASGARNLGDAVSSLGSTLVLKLISDKPVFNAEYGVYSHRLGDNWLVGGASNSGGAVLAEYFDSQQLEELSRQIDLSAPCGLDYYPLNTAGERFPINNPQHPPKLTPRPDSDVEFLYALLNGIANIELLAYQRLHQLGCPYPTRVLSCGGGAKNSVWQQLREQKLGIPVLVAEQEEAAFGSALLAYNHF
ncbi:MAG: FGGY-family carbohydrate kinase [Gammaproteobacteria bacterium]|nr:FGGY-family carbohydrate kinase [Gammaproteobacteria bacterium]